MGAGLGVDIGVPVGVEVTVAVALGVIVAVAVALPEGVAVGVAVVVAVAVGVALGVTVAVGVALVVGVAVGVVVAVGVGLGAPDCAQYPPPVSVTAGLLATLPPQTIISLPFQIAVCKSRPSGSLCVLVTVQSSVSGLYLPPLLK